MYLTHALRAITRAVVSAADPFFKYVSLLLTGNGPNNGQNNTFLDNSTNNYNITRNGTPTQGTFSPFGDNWSNYFDGSSDYIRRAGAGVLTASGDVTIECWIYPLSSSVIGIFDGGPNESAILRNYPANKICRQNDEGGGASFTVTTNQWQHFACTFTGGNIKVYINGSLNASGTYSSTYGAGSNFDIGTINTGGDGSFNGYISNFRVTKSILYTTTFTPSTTPLTAITNTSLLTCQSNRFIDNSANNFTITKSGDVSVQRFSPFNPSAGYTPSAVGGSARFATTSNTTANLSATLTGASAMTTWTIEMFSYAETSSINDQVLLGPWTPNLIRVSGSTLQVYLSGGDRFSISGALPINQWNHLAICCDSTNLRLYINGVRVATAAIPNLSISMASVVLGAQATNSTANDRWPGYISNFRVVNGTALYTNATYIVPTAPLTAITNTNLLLNFTNGAIIDNAMINDLETVGDAKTSTTISKFGGSSMYFDGTGDWLTSRNTDNIPATGNFTIEGWIYRNTAGLGIRQDIVNQHLDATLGRVSISIDANNKINFFQGVSPSNVLIVGTTTMAANQWYHFAVTRVGTTFTVYLNGTSEGTGTSSQNVLQIQLVVGAINSAGTYIGNLNGYLDDLRITKGYARYTANFTPPTAALPTF
jgi:hypothetical protein